jgi:competence/damage-inducible protein CinA-like protein
MNAHILTIGDELLIGQVLNTNAAFIGSQLSEINIDVDSISVVGDDDDKIISEFDKVWTANDLIIVTGGLGPTHDDITRKCIIKYFKTELVENEDVLNDITEFVQKRGRTISKTAKGQALVPKIASVIRNHRGTAPGYWIEKDEKIFIVLPGVPYELEGMFEEQITQQLAVKFKNTGYVIKRSTLLTTGIPESTLSERLGDLNEILSGAKLAFLPNQYGVRLRVTVKEPTEEEAQNKLSEIEQKIRGKVGRYIYGKNDDTLEGVVGRLLKERGLKLAVAESCTGGNVSNLITNISGSSDYFERGIVSYSNASKVEILRVNEDAIVKHGAVSLEIARQMAEGVKSISGSDLGLSLTGIMGPTGASAEKAVGLVYIGLCDEKVCTAKKFQFGDNRIINKQRTSQAALDMLRRYLLGISFDD